jgi:hypothetical protein
MLELPGVAVKIGPASFELTSPDVDEQILAGAAHLVADSRRAILRVPGVGTFAIADGRSLSFDPESSVREGAASVWLHGTVAALALAQQGRFALHASVVEIDGAGVAVAGPRNAGKSTTALRLEQRGHRLVTDDVSPVAAGGSMTVYPYDRPVHVYAQTAATLGLDVSLAQPVLPDHPKLAMPTASGGPVPLRGIAILENSELDCAVRVQPARGARAHWLVTMNIYRADVLQGLWQDEMFTWAAEIALRVPVSVVVRPVAEWTIDEVAAAIEEIARDGGDRQGNSLQLS